MTPSRSWAIAAIRTIEADFNRSADTHLIPLDLPAFPGIDVYLKDESSHPTGSLKHRLARSLFLYALANGWLHARSTVIEASSGSTAISEAYFARLLGLPFIAVMPATVSPDKIAAIEFYGGGCHLVQDPTTIYSESERLARATRGHFMDQFTYAERATDWRANNNIAESIFKQMELEQYPQPAWIVASAGTGGTTATLGRYVRYRRHGTRIACVDPENSVFFDFYAAVANGALPQDVRGHFNLDCGSRIEGIGRPRVEASFLPSVIDTMFKVPDALSIGAMRWLASKLGRRVGGSTGSNLVGVLALAHAMHTAGEQGSIVTLLCDSGDRYGHSYYNDAWLAERGLDVATAQAQIAACAESGAALPRSVQHAPQS
ncbi:putative siderophore biosynthesis protein SbnA [Andreprevotia sp. IGB-42]|uniref:PLP-dependent cysteine synthase family protein n=1 Tax=Andreprevotia sp. IGB-42 TaxID=2497473 RepID=UPI001358EB88|nr:PLP-dependent cysteine synthase family protein [Andreprevotia sp. IGB-42]KAF0811363.1 putative siderophore biosynthesis protein SbnA [Andreprevotia sp. IGB-42]